MNEQSCVVEKGANSEQHWKPKQASRSVDWGDRLTKGDR